tara:strand:+ start:1575 stop:1790 length:216 start_codon:yes stop_codon:yes gene_type:complete
MCVEIKTIFMSSEIKYRRQEDQASYETESKVKLTDLLSRLNQEKKRERNSNIALSVAAVSAVTVFGIILSL